MTIVVQIKNNDPSVMLTFTKKVDGKYCCSRLEMEKIWAKSVYATKTEASQESNMHSTLNLDVRDDLATASTDSISHSEQKSNARNSLMDRLNSDELSDSRVIVDELNAQKGIYSDHTT